MVTTNAQDSGKFKLQPLKDKSSDVLEVGLSEGAGEKKAFFQTSTLDKPQSVDWIIESFKNGNRVILLDIRPLRGKNKVDELKRAVDRLKLQVEKTGKIMQLDENWLMLLPADIDLLD